MQPARYRARIRTTFLALLLLLAGCEAPKPAEGRQSPTGWALYCRSEGAETVFFLVEGVRRRPRGEVEAHPFVTGLDALGREFATLAPGEVITCCYPEEGLAKGFDLPMYTTDLGKALEARGRAHGVTVRTGSW